MQYKRTVVINYTKERCYLGVNVIWSVGLRNSEGEKRTEVSCLIVMTEPNISLHAVGRSLFEVPDVKVQKS